MRRGLADTAARMGRRGNTRRTGLSPGRNIYQKDSEEGKGWLGLNLHMDLVNIQISEYVIPIYLDH